MTMSILARDPASGCLGAAAVTGNLCVGAWVLRGDARAGLTASQGELPSTLWGEDALDAIRGGAAAKAAVERVSAADAGRDWRQLAALDRTGAGGAFTGARNRDWKGALVARDLVVAGNILKGSVVLDAAHDAYSGADGALADRLLAALRAGLAEGGDSRGHLSAALLVLSERAPPLDLRIDGDPEPVEALSRLLARTRQPDYVRWVASLPVRSDPERRP
jgi:uncharacterized Ntn-hydrolase superfamily protein